MRQRRFVSPVTTGHVARPTELDPRPSSAARSRFRRPGDVVEFVVVDRVAAVEARRDVGGGSVGHHPARVDRG